MSAREPPARYVKSLEELLRDLDREKPPAPVASAPSSSRFQRTNSVSSISSLDSMDQLEKVIQNMTSAMPDVAIDATYSVSSFWQVRTVKVRNLLASEEQRLLVVERLDTIFHALGVQLSLVRSLHLRDGSNNKTCNELIRAVCNFLTTVCFNILGTNYGPGCS